MAEFSLKALFDVNEIKNRPVKFVVTIFLLLFFMSLTGYLLFESFRFFTGGYVNMFGWEPNGPREKESLQTTNSKRDTVYLPPPESARQSHLSTPAFADYKEKPQRQSKARRADTVSVQQTTVNGNDAHIISGNGNTVGVNGNVSVTEQPELDEWYKQFFIRHINQVRADSAITNNKVMIFVGNGSNAGQFVSQLKDYLNSKDYEVEVGTTMEPFKGVGVHPMLYLDNITKVVGIWVGNITR